METIKNYNSDNQNTVDNNKNKNSMKRLNLLFIEGNRQKIDKTNVKEAYLKIKEYGFIKSMALEYVPMDKAKSKIGNKALFKATVIRKTGEGEPTISNFDIRTETVKPEEYDNYDGVCVDGQHRTLALLFSNLQNEEVTYAEAEIPQNMDILAYVAIRNNGKPWKNNDFTHSGIATNNKEIDHILTKCKSSKIEDTFFYSIYTLTTSTLKAKQIKALQQGYKKIQDFKKLQLSPITTEMGDKVMETIQANKTFTSDRCNGRFGTALKKFYIDNNQDFQTLLDVIALIDNDIWENHFTAEKGHSMEIAAYTDALQSVWLEYQGTTQN